MKSFSFPPVTSWLLWLLPVAGFYGLLLRFGQGIPTADDFQASLNFVYNFFFTGKNTHEQGLLLFSQHNEHRILVSRLTALALYELGGRLDLHLFLWVQQVFWVALVFLIIRLGHSVRLWQSGWRGLPVVLLLFHPNTSDTLLHVWGGSQTYPVLLFTVLSLCALHGSTTAPQSALWLTIALLAAGLATFSFGNGFLVWGAGAVYLLLRRRRAVLAGWLLVSAVMVAFYLWHYQRPLHGDPAYLAPIRLLAVVKFALLFPGAPFMATWPSPALALPNLLVCYALGTGCWLYAFRLVQTGYGLKNPLLFSLLAVALGTGVLLALGRSSMGAAGALTSRYQLFANLIPLLLYLIWADHSPKPGWVPYAGSVGLVFVSVLTVWHLWPRLAQQYTENETGLTQWVWYRTPTLAIEAAQQRVASEQLERCLARGIFATPTQPADQPVSRLHP